MAEGGLAVKLRGTGPVGIAAAVTIVGANLAIAPLGAILVLTWKWAADVPWADLGFRRPRSWVATIVGGIAIGMLFKLVMKALVIPLLGGPGVNAHFAFIAGNTQQMISMVVASIIVAGFGEEIVYRGFMFERLWRAFGESRAATAAIVILTTVLFAVIHIPEQGPYGAAQAAFTGLVFATIYAATRNLWLPIVIHAAFDITAVMLIYFGAESAVAHWFFA
jgi:uncharacterized protein